MIIHIFYMKTDNINIPVFHYKWIDLLKAWRIFLYWKKKWYNLKWQKMNMNEIYVKWTLNNNWNIFVYFLSNFYVWLVCLLILLCTQMQFKKMVNALTYNEAGLLSVCIFNWPRIDHVDSIANLMRQSCYVYCKHINLPISIYILQLSLNCTPMQMQTMCLNWSSYWQLDRPCE